MNVDVIMKPRWRAAGDGLACAWLPARDDGANRGFDAVCIRGLMEEVLYRVRHDRVAGAAPSRRIASGGRGNCISWCGRLIR